MTNNTEVTVTQADRKNAADLLDELSNLLDHNGIGQVADLIRDGEYDEHCATQAFAQHRTRSMGEGEPFAWTGSVSWHKPAHRAVMASVKIGSWLSAALEDPKVCDEMKADIHEWFSAGEPMETLCQALAISPKPNDSVDAVREADWPTQAEWDSHTQEERIVFLNRHYAALQTQPAARDVVEAEALGEALFALSARLKASGFLDETTNHAAYEKVVVAFAALSQPAGEGS